MATRAEPTIEDLYLVTEDGKAEIVDGEVVPRTGGKFLEGLPSSPWR